jgi:hypothetical protein
MRAELVENSNHALKIQIVKQSGGGSGTILAQSTVKDSNGATAVYNLNDWWYLRFEFDGNKYRARAWKMGTLQYNPLTQAADDPDTQTDEGCAAGGRWQVCATAGSASSGTIGIRTSNSDGSARPVVQFEGLWVQTIGFSIHMLLQIPEAQNNAPSSGQLYGRYKYNIFGKGTDGTNREYTFRYHDDDCPAPPHMPSDCHPGEYHLKAYINSLEGLKGAGVDYAVTQPTAPDDPNRAQITGGTDSIIDNYLQVVFMFDPGDALDPSAGVSLYVNGEKVGGPDPASPAGPRYNGTVDCQDSIDTPIADPQLALWGYPGVPGACTGGQCSFKSRVDTRIVCSTSADCGGRPCEIPLETGGSQKYCRVRYLCSEGTGCNCGSDGYCKENCWDIYPLNGNAPLRIGQRDPVDGETFSGWFEELAIFSRKLTDLEIAKLREWQQP